MKKPASAFLLVNLASLFISTSGILGKLIQLPSMVTSFFRCLLGVVFLTLLVSVMKRPLTIQWDGYRKEFVASGLLLALHWSTYFYSLQVSNVSIAIISLFTYPILTTLIEPVFFGGKLELVNIFTSGMVLAGVIVLVPEFSLENNYTLGLVIGLLSALFYAMRNLVSKKLVQVFPGDTTLIIQLVFAGVFLLPSLLVCSYQLDLSTWLLLLALGLITTALGHTLFLLALRQLTTSSASVLASLQPVYAILLAVVLIGEKLERSVIIGGSMILGAVVVQNLWPGSIKKGI